MQIVGQYTEKVEPIDYSRYIAPNFFRAHAIGNSCGEKALHQLTKKGFTPKELDKYDSNGILPMEDMIAILKKRKYTVVPLSVCAVTNGRDIINSVQNKHVVLNCQVFFRGEASWSICYNNMYFHEWWTEANILEFINRPILASWIIWHKSWK